MDKYVTAGVRLYSESFSVDFLTLINKNTDHVVPKVSDSGNVLANDNEQTNVLISNIVQEGRPC